MHSLSYLKESLSYDSSSGLFYWNRDAIKGSNLKAGRVAGSKDAHGYVQINVQGCVLKAHRVAWAFVYGDWPSGQIDHINHDRADNRIENLRVVDNTGNHLNRPIQSNNKTGFVGVSKFKRTGKFVAYITSNGKRIHLGYFNLIEEAVKARDEANEKYGFHKNHGTKKI